MSETGSSVPSLVPGATYVTRGDDDMNEDVTDDEKQRENSCQISTKSSLPPSKHYLSKSVLNLAPPPPSSSLFRSESSLSLASSIGSSNSVTVSDIRTLASNYQKMLRQATKEIKKQNSDFHKLQQDQEKLLEANVELALETKILLIEQKEWKKDEQDLIHANEEFASEVEKLYKAEEEQLKERESLEKEMKELEDRLELENSVLILKHQEEKEGLETQLSTAVQENEELSTKNKSLDDEISCSHEYIRSSYKGDMAKFESTIENLENALTKEKELRVEGEVKIWKLSQEIEYSESELKSIQVKYHDNLTTIESKVIKLKEQNEKLGTENFEYVVENDDLKKKQDEQLENEKKMRKEIGQLNIENQWLINDQKNKKGNGDWMEVNEGELDSVKTELKEEKEKVKDLSSWKYQLVEKNKELTKDNDRLFNRAEYLESLVNDEVTDINEILTVINTIQVEKKVPI